MTDAFLWSPRGWLDRHGNPHQIATCERCGSVFLGLARTDRGRFCSRRCAGRTGAISYNALHQRVYAARGKAASCVWGCQSTRYEWANMTGNLEDPDDYVQMCKRCHDRYDRAQRMMAEGFVSHNTGKTVLTADAVRDARTRVANGETIASLASEYSVRTDTLWNAVRGKTWRYIS